MPGSSICSSDSHNRCHCFHWGRFRNGNHMGTGCEKLVFCLDVSWEKITTDEDCSMLPVRLDTGYLGAIVAVTFMETDGSTDEQEGVAESQSRGLCPGRVLRSCIGCRAGLAFPMPGFWSKNSCVCFHIPSLTHALMLGKLKGLSVRKKSQDNKKQSWKKMNLLEN